MRLQAVCEAGVWVARRGKQPQDAGLKAQRYKGQLGVNLGTALLPPTGAGGRRPLQELPESD